jgi:hypothetical protein
MDPFLLRHLPLLLFLLLLVQVLSLLTVAGLKSTGVMLLLMHLHGLRLKLLLFFCWSPAA